MFSRQKYKVYIEHLSLARKHIERAEKIIQVSDDRFMLVQEEIARVVSKPCLAVKNINKNSKK